MNGWNATLVTKSPTAFKSPSFTVRDEIVPNCVCGVNVVVWRPLLILVDAPSTIGPSQFVPVIGTFACKSWNTETRSISTGTGF